MGVVPSPSPKQANVSQIYPGVGLEWEKTLQEDIALHFSRLSCVEIVPENFFEGARKGFLRKLAQSGIPVAIHSIELSLGTDEAFKESHFEQVRRVADEVNTIQFSDHLCFTEAGGVAIGQLTTLPWTRSVADVVSRKIETVQKHITVPFLIENITNVFLVPRPELSETEFINLILRRTGCSLLLDLNNVYTNGVNFGFDPLSWLEAIDLPSVRGVHLAGGYPDSDGMLVDSHGAPIPEPVWGLYEWLCRQVAPDCTFVERTNRIPPITELLGEVERARQILEACGRIRASEAIK